MPEHAGSPALASNWPNPFSNGTTINFRLAASGAASVIVTDVQGRIVATLADGQMTAGGHSVSWNGKDAAGREAPNGIYLFRLAAGGRIEVRRWRIAEVIGPSRDRAGTVPRREAVRGMVP